MQPQQPMQMQLPMNMNGVNGNGNGNGLGNGNGNGLDMTELARQANAAGYTSVQAFLADRKAAKMAQFQQLGAGQGQGQGQRQMQMQMPAQQQQQQQVSNGTPGGQANGANGMPNAGAGGNHRFASSPQLQNTQMQLKLPPRAAQRLAEKAQAGPPAQRA